MFGSAFQRLSKRQTLIAVIFLLVLSFFTYVWNFWNPAALFWDENYHIASAQKYINGTFFMEPHPPLGKLVIALGEVIVDANPDDTQFIGTDYATNPPPGFSFFGYRLFPVLFAWLTTPLIFGIFFLITRRTLWALLLSFLYVFDNALIVHQRSAMLESTLIFFSMLTIFAFLFAIDSLKDRTRLRRAAILLGISLAGVMTTKAFGLIFVMLFPFLLFAMRTDWKKCVRFLAITAVSFIIPFVAIWQIHFIRASTINPSLPDAGYYQASEEYKAILQNGKNDSLFAFPWMIRDSMHFVSHYEAGVPRLDLCKEDENGSPWYLWPFGARTINYRWETPDGSGYKYLYLVSNPAGWFLGLLGVVLTAVILGGSVLLPLKEQPKQRLVMLAFFTLYCCYMIAVSRIDRVMYLYHYFLPLLFSFFLFALVFNHIEMIGKWKLQEDRKTSLLLLLGVIVFLGFQFYWPLTYYQTIGDHAFARRNLLRTWELRCVQCEADSPIVVR